MASSSCSKQKVVIAGGGTAGWLAASALSKKLGDVLDITLIESDEIGTVGVGEATIPPMRVFHSLLRIDEQDFMRETQATFKLGILFDDWRQRGKSYIHSFGKNGKESWLCDFHHFWLHARAVGIDTEFGDYCFELQAAKAGRFATSANSDINYAYHLDASEYAKYLRKISEGNGLRRVEGKIRDVNLDTDTGFIESLTLESGETVAGDVFIDCTGFRGLLIEQTLHTGYENWGHWLPCDRAVAVQTESTGPAVPYTRSIAHDAGWRWRIPLQRRVGNGLVYCGKYMSDDEAIATLMQAIEGDTLTEPRVLRFATGRRLKSWNKNCIALGLATGFVEPLESTSIHLIMTGVTRLMQLFPFDGVTQSLMDRYNEQTRLEIEKIRDFIVLHYHVTDREDTPFWRGCRAMKIPSTLEHRIDLFRENAQAFQADGELFRVDSWTQVMLGQGIMPERYHHMARMMSDTDLLRFLSGLRASIGEAVSKLPTHQEFLDRYCKSADAS